MDVYNFNEIGPSKDYLLISDNYCQDSIAKNVPEASHVEVKVFNILSQEVRTLTDAQYEAGFHSVRWDGKDTNGNAVSSGVYLYQLKAGSLTQVKKMSLLR